jgi:glyoxylase-like metal-dependent hydrolase (beta-lactamase superfamily II)
MTLMWKRILQVFLGLCLVVAALAFAGSRRRYTDHAVTTSPLGVSSRGAALEALVDQPGPVTVETVVGADWQVSRSGLINLDNPVAKAARLTDGNEPIQIFFHAVRHPAKGLFLVDTGVERALSSDPSHAAIHGLVATLVHADWIKTRNDTASWLARQTEPVRGVFVTHLHFDHISGMRDVPAATPVYVGRGEAEDRGFLNMFTAGITDAALEGKGALREWQFQPDPDGVFDGVLDVFGDGTVWAISVPGHTVGSVAYVIRTPNGPVLLAGDTCHTAWGWEHGVEPGSFTADQVRNARSLAILKRFAARHPKMDVRLGHQFLARAAP